MTDSFAFTNWRLVCLVVLLLPSVWLNWLLPPTFFQPDWLAALLIGALLAQWRHYLWVWPVACLHDLMMYWALWPSMLLWLLIPGLLIWLDAIAGAGMPQRLLVLMLIPFTWLWLGWSWPAVTLTTLLSFFFWYLWAKFPMAEHYAPSSLFRR